MNPQTLLAVESVEGLGLPPAIVQQIAAAEAAMPLEMRDLRLILASAPAPVPTRVAFAGAHRVDVAQARRLEGMEGVELVPLAGPAQHNVAHRLIAEGRLAPLLFD